jgi:large subunit ribosomal protein L25
MRYQTIRAKARDGAATGSKLKELRRSGEMPAVMSRQDAEPVAFSFDVAEFGKAVHKAGVGGILELVEEGGAKHLGLLKELQWHPVTRKLYHASFQEVKKDQVVNTTVHLRLIGEPKPVSDKTGQLIKNNESIEVHAKVSSLPDHITIDLSDMLVGDVLTAGDVPLPDGVEALHKDTVICSVTTPTVVHIEVPTAETDALGAAVQEPQTESEASSAKE